MFENKTILITGGTGSFGKTMLQNLLAKKCGNIRIFSRDEEKQDVLRSDLSAANVDFYLGDIRDKEALLYAMPGVDMVFHAAALKQVPSCEFFPTEAVKTNVLGSANVIDAAIENKVKSVVCLSTDKAVMPINAMGMSKAMMEKVAAAKSRRKFAGETVISCVRYGNVMHSRGSVIPLFIKLIKQGKELTITNPDMTRFLMPLRDSVRLVEFALEKARPGDMFIKKSPAATVEVLAKALLELFNASTGMRNIGTRHGEKLHETLATAEELARSKDLGDFYCVMPDQRDLNYNAYFNKGDIEVAAQEDYTSYTTERLTVEQTKALLLSLPELQKELES